MSKPRKTELKIMCSSDSFRDSSAYRVKTIKGLGPFKVDGVTVYLSPDSGGWHATEAVTGFGVGRGRTRLECLECVSRNLKTKTGMTKVQRAMWKLTDEGFRLPLNPLEVK